MNCFKIKNKLSILFRYVEYYGLKEPCDNIFEVLLHIAKTKNKIKIKKEYDNSTKKIFDIDGAGQMMIKNFFDGLLGKSMLDDDLIQNIQEEESLELEKYV